MTGTRRTAPHVQPSSGWGHWVGRPQARQRTVTQESAHVWSVMTAAVAPRAIGGTTGAPHVQGNTGGA
ncbi:hypothetical protein CP970_08425 [Streptomyces kanamyceticus]|uniref:Uncharacterized protein n=1 Tax=Streptomyces kanamyceticus TaxID=1967 RepID=A0A5J6G5S4_STRKN|nr:hypothetical protein CP970_08425 [Streptomyces kanamyceticus]